MAEKPDRWAGCRRIRVIHHTNIKRILMAKTSRTTTCRRIRRNTRGNAWHNNKNKKEYTTMEWINTAWQWIETNIVPLLTTTNIMMVLGVIFSLFKQKRSIMDNTASSRDLRRMLDTVKLQSAALDEQTAGLAALKAETDALKESAALDATKIDAMLDILHTVFMAQNLPAGSKQVIDGFYTNARYAETQQRAAIVKQVEDLKAQLASMTAAMAEKVDSAETTVKKIVGAKSTETQTVKPAVNLK
nr:MAG TPA: hypothetical protein [Caudoviricetes sp.]